MTDEIAADPTLGFLRRYPPYERMKPEHLAFLGERLREIRFSDGDAITDPAAGPAEWFYLLKEGLIVGEEFGEDETISGNAFELLPGECFPIGALVGNRPVRNVQRAVGDVVCLAMPRAAFAELREKSKIFNDYCTSRLSGLLEKVKAQVKAEAARGLGDDDGTLNIALSQKPMPAPVTVPPDASIRDVLVKMSSLAIGSMIVVDPEGRPTGIFTLKDLMRRVVLPGVTDDRPIGEVMTRDPITVPRSAFAFEAAMKMANYKIQHLAVVEDEKLVGVLSERDLFSMQRVGMVNLSKSISRAANVEEVARLASDVHVLVAQMIAQGQKVGQITQIITLLNDHIAVRLIELALADHGGVPPVPFTWIAFGSEGRQEQTLKTDQDNGILFEAPEGMSADEARALLMPLAEKINLALDACGFPLCTGGIMAKNPECCLSMDEWKTRFAQWIDQGTPEHVLKSSIFFDFRTIWGPREKPGELREWLMGKAGANRRFQKQMAANALQNAPPLGLIRDFRLSGTGAEANTIDLKFSGVTIFIDAARIMSLGRNVPDTNTVERLRAVAAAGGIDPHDADAWVDAYDYIRLLRMRINQDQATEGRELSNRVAPTRLNDLDRRILKEAFREARRLQVKLALDYQL